MNPMEPHRPRMAAALDRLMGKPAEPGLSTSESRIDVAISEMHGRAPALPAETLVDSQERGAQALAALTNGSIEVARSVMGPPRAAMSPTITLEKQAPRLDLAEFRRELADVKAVVDGVAAQQRTKPKPAPVLAATAPPVAPSLEESESRITRAINGL